NIGSVNFPIFAYQRALEINPQDAIAWYEQGKLLQKSQQYERASSAYNMAIGIQPKYSQALARQTETLNKLQNYELALQMSDLALAGDRVWSEETTLAYLWNQRSSALVHLKKYEESIADAERAIALKRDYAEAWNNKAVSLWNLNKYIQAEQASLKAINFAQKNTQAWFNRGRILSSLRRYPEAIKAYEKALAGDLKKEDNFIHGSIWTNKGVAYWYEAKKLQQPQQKSQKYLRAYLNLKKATEINSKSFEAWYNKAAVILEWQYHDKKHVKASQKKYNEALTAYNKANEINPNNSAVLTGKAMILVRLDKYQDALTNFNDALNIDPDNILAQKQRDKLLVLIQNQRSNE
ncbi:MAG: tetratricopeptide repeat protein, partial [Cyanobacteria bacterium J06639_18]